MKTFETFYVPEYVSVTPSGKTVQRPEYLAGVRDLMKGATKVTCAIKFTGVKTHDKVVDVAFDFSGKLFKANGVTTLHEVGVDRWKKTGKVWIEIKTVDKAFNVTAPKSGTSQKGN